MMNTTIIKVLVIFLSIQLVKTTTTKVHRIVGGKVGPIEKHPYMVSIRAFPSEHLCGGSIISSSIVLTAAHCVYNFQDLEQLSNYYPHVVVGATLLLNDSHSYPMAQIWIHEDFDLNAEAVMNDIGIVKIGEVFKFGPTIQPIKLYVDEVPDCGTCTAVGYGETKPKNGDDFNRTEMSIQLRSVELKKIPYCDCKAAFKDIDNVLPLINNYTLCAGGITEIADTCQGDSGGPLVYQSQLCGIVSLGFGCGDKRYPGIYLKVAEYVEWIKQFIQE